MNNSTLYHEVGTRRASALAAGVAVIATLLSLGCQSAPTLPPKDALIPSRPVILSPGDIVKVTFAGAPELSQTQRIRADGKLSLPQIGEVQAAGKLLPQFQSELEGLYEPELTNSDVLVTLDYGVTSVYMSGAVNHPGKLSFDRPTTILQAIAEAGGATMFGSLKKVRVVRLEKGRQHVQTLDLRSAMKGTIKRPVTGPFYVRDGDIISVPQSAF
jgi:protein involved in polysaccharide export with SLBB domain